MTNHEPFIPGMCRVWSRRRRSEGVESTYWVAMPYAARGYRDCANLIEYYEDRFGNLYDYAITADSDLCRPVG